MCSGLSLRNLRILSAAALGVFIGVADVFTKSSVLVQQAEMHYELDFVNGQPNLQSIL